ncbi:MAG: tripartite tricarboxylate transporter substrate binding protein [Sporomusaceae bacterium]|nr:tripartite tricarboxylate transporter substrate binding protein [Sporomusaceae bacterium]
MRKTLSLSIIALLVIALALAGCGGAQTAKKAEVNFPTKPIELIVPFAAGGGTDAVARAFAEALKVQLKQDVVIVNKTGGGGAVGMTEGLKAKADGHSITMITREVVSLPLQGQAAFKTFDFRLIANVNTDPAVIVVPANSKYQKIEDMLADMKANPDKLNFAASVTPNFYGIQLSNAANVKFTTIPFNGAAPAITELLGGRADFGIYGPGEAKAQIDAGKLRPLAVMAENRFAGLKDVPTLKEKGSDAVTGTYRGIAVPPGTPEEVVKTLETAVAAAVKDPKFIEFMTKNFLGIDYKNAADYKTFLESDIKVLGPIIEAGKKK